MRWIIAAIGLVAAALLFAASVSMNWSFWTAQATDAASAHSLGAVSIGLDLFKTMLPVVIAWSWTKGHRLGAVIATVFFGGCLVFSFASALGFASSARDAVTAGRETKALRYAAAEQELADSKNRLTKLSASRPQSVVEEAIARAQQDRRWTSSKECREATAEASRVFCQEVGDLRIELAAAVESEGLREREQNLKQEIDRLLADGARLDKDPQAGVLAKLTGIGIARMQTVLVVLLALLVEIGAAFGLFLAMLPLRTRDPRPAAAIGLVAEPRARAEPLRLPPPTRFIRAPDGRLMIE